MQFTYIGWICIFNLEHDSILSASMWLIYFVHNTPIQAHLLLLLLLF